MASFAFLLTGLSDCLEVVLHTKTFNHVVLPPKRGGELHLLTSYSTANLPCNLNKIQIFDKFG